MSKKLSPYWEEAIAAIFNICWAIWKGRNRMVFDQVKSNPACIIKEAHMANIEFFLAVDNMPVQRQAYQVASSQRDGFLLHPQVLKLTLV